MHLREDLSLIAIQGPESYKVLEKIIPNSNKLKFMNGNDFKFEGMNIRDISVKEKKDPFDWLIDNALSKYGMNDLFIAELLNNDNNEVKKLLLHDKSTVSLSDAGAHLSLLCDAGYGLDLLGKWSRELNIISLEQAVFKLTGKQADICRIP